MAKEFSRTQRISDQVQKELAQIIQLEMKDPRLGLVTVSTVEVSRDLAFADVYISFLNVDGQEQAKELLDVFNHASGFLRSQLARAIKLRFIPKLRFYYDASLSRGQHLSSLIERVVAEDQSRRGD